MSWLVPDFSVGRGPQGVMVVPGPTEARGQKVEVGVFGTTERKIQLRLLVGLPVAEVRYTVAAAPGDHFKTGAES